MFKTQRTIKPTKKLKYQRPLSKSRFLAKYNLPLITQGNIRLLKKKLFPPPPINRSYSLNLRFYIKESFCKPAYSQKMSNSWRQKKPIISNIIKIVNYTYIHILG